MNAGTGMVYQQTNKQPQFAWRRHGISHQRSIIRSELRCGSAGVILDLLVLKQLAAISIAVILFTLYLKVSASLLTTIRIWNRLS